MKVDVTVAGIEPHAFVQVRLAGHLLAAQQWRVVVREWDGTRCDVLIADLDDAYGRQAMALADRRGTPVIALAANEGGEPRRTFARDAEALQLAQAIRALLPEKSPAPASAPPVDARALAGIPAATDAMRQTNALLRLASEEGLYGIDVRATVAGRTIGLSPAAGRATATSLADLLTARDQLGTAQWQMQAQAAEGETGDVSISLDAFYVGGALRLREELPPFPDGLYRLRDWPDLGAAPVLVGALRVAHALTRAAHTPRALSEHLQLPLSEVHACLWAFRASGLLLREANANAPVAPASVSAAVETVAPVARERPASSLLSKIARHFGIGRAVANASG